MIGAMHKLEQLDMVLKVMPRCGGIDNMIADCLGAVPHLKELGMRATSDVLRAVLCHLDRVPFLSYLKLETTSSVFIGGDFSKLPTLQALSRLTILAPGLRCTPQQVQHLCACKSLQTLKAGSWSPSPTLFYDHIQETINTTIAALASAMTSSRRPPLQLDLSNTVLTSEVWAHVRRMTSLHCLEPEQWDIGDTAQEWDKLSSFRTLRKLSIALRKDVCVDVIARNIATLPRLRHLTFKAHAPTLVVSDCCLGMMCSTRLKQLTLASIRISPKGLERLPRNLTKLELNWCSGHEGNPLKPRLSLPPLPRLRNLIICEPEGHRLTKAEAEPLRVALLERCPLLLSQRFVTNDT
jgi:hypothetical protein